MALQRLRAPDKRASRDPKPRVLYIEDEDPNWEVTEFMLRSQYELVRAANARETFSRLRASKFDLILMDIQLQGSELDGIQITQILKGRYTKAVPSYAQGVVVDCPILFVTAYEARYQRQELIEAGGDELITKPVDRTRLLLALSKLTVRAIFPTS